MRIAVLGALAALVVGTTAGIGPEPAAAGREQTRLQAAVDAIRDLGVPGVVAEVRDGDRRTVARSGVADIRTSRPMPYRGYVRIASNTKVFIATLVMLLVGEGRLGLDDTVERWLPGLVTGNGNDGRRITVRNLLQHTSGLVDYGADLPIQSGEDFQRERFRTYQPEQLVAMSMRHPPGEKHFGYTNVNYVLAGMIVERVTGDPWEVGIRDRIARPLRLRQTFGPGTWPLLPGPHAHTYFQFPGEPLTDTTALNVSVVDAAGALVSSLSDLNNFLRALVRGELLRPAELALMERTIFAGDDVIQDLYPGTEYGLGLMRRPLSCGGGYWSHVGEGIVGATRNGVTPDGRRPSWSICPPSCRTGTPASGRRLPRRTWSTAPSAGAFRAVLPPTPASGVMLWIA